MRTRKLILLLAVVALSVALVSVLSACGGDGDTTTPAATTTAGDTVTTTAQAGDVTTAATTTAPVVTTTAAPTSFNATFKDEDGTVIATVRFRVGDTALTEPALPTKAGYLAEWSKYRLGSSDIEVTVIYTSIAEGSQGLEFVKNADLSGYIVTGYNGSNRAVAIPATYKAEEDAVALPVVEIATIAFRGEDIVSLYIPESVVTIGDNAFAQCDSLKTVELPAGLTALGNYAFFSCDSLESVTFPASLTKISSHAFAQCVSLKNLTFKTATVEGVTVGLANIATDAFSGCSSIETLILPDTMATSGNTTSIGAAAFLGCIGLKTLVLPSGLTTLVADTFLGCNAIETLTANAGVLPYIPNTSLTTVTLTGGATLAPSAFKGADRLTTLHLPATLTTLPAGRLDDCLSLTTITVDAANTLFSVRADGALYYAKEGEV
ncbi:MAG: leucine-rich repeat protein, partial [Clostridia bacterium]|nr:leucine-rich repeat protein [Clostridia bacterium]